jgi:hypothetical protein
VDNDTPKYILCLKRNNVTIACPVTYDFDNKLLTFRTIPENMPKLFCNFPLIGSEEYSFPIIVNSYLFDVEIDRNAIRDGNAENKKIIEEAVSLYKKLIDYCTENVITRNEFNICLLKNRQYSGLQKYCYNEYRLTTLLTIISVPVTPQILSQIVSDIVILILYSLEIYGTSCP